MNSVKYCQNTNLLVNDTSATKQSLGDMRHRKEHEPSIFLGLTRDKAVEGTLF